VCETGWIEPPDPDRQRRHRHRFPRVEPGSDSRLHAAPGLSRYPTFAAVGCILLGATALLSNGAAGALSVLRGRFASPVDALKARSLILACIELTDLLLLATVFHVIAIGLFELFSDDRLDLPNSPEIHDLNHLNEKLIVVMAELSPGQA